MPDTTHSSMPEPLMNDKPGKKVDRASDHLVKHHILRLDYGITCQLYCTMPTVQSTGAIAIAAKIYITAMLVIDQRLPKSEGSASAVTFHTLGIYNDRWLPSCAYHQQSPIPLGDYNDDMYMRCNRLYGQFTTCTYVKPCEINETLVARQRHSTDWQYVKPCEINETLVARQRHSTD
eukprot:1348446-Pleurochrysis_carterae.AAC.2